MLGKSFRRILLCSLLTILVSAAKESARGSTIVNFDDLPGAEGIIPDGYTGLNWNFSYIDTAAGWSFPKSAYSVGVVSGTKVAIPGQVDAFGTSIASISVPTRFDFLGGYFSTPFGDKLSINIKGYQDGNLLYSTFAVASDSHPTLISLNFLGVDEVQFSSPSPSSIPGFGNFTMDDLIVANITPVPLPPSLPLLGSAIVAITFLRRKR